MSSNSSGFATNEPPLWIRTGDGILGDDIPTRPGGRMPDFCVIGAAKAGTTSLNRYLGQHPQVFMCPVKEPHYFSTDAIFEKGASWYQGLFIDAAHDQTCGEASTTYSRFPDCPATAQRIKSANPEMKLLYIVREPVARVESECLQVMKYAKHVAGQTGLPQDVDGMLDLLTSKDCDLAINPIHASDYFLQIEHILEYFPPDQLMVVLMEDLKKAPDRLLQEVCRFIGVSPNFAFDLSRKSNCTGDFVTGKIAEDTANQLKQVPGFRVARSLLPIPLRKKLVYQIGKARLEDNFHLSSARATELRAHFRESNEKLVEFLGRDLSHWGT